MVKFSESGFYTLKYNLLSWEPSAAKVTKSYSAVYPHCKEYKSRTTQFGISNPSWEYSRKSSEFPDQNLRQIGPGFTELWSDKQTGITTLNI